MKKSKLTKFQDDFISIDGVMTSQFNPTWRQNDVKNWWRHIYVKNVGIVLKLCRFSTLLQQTSEPIIVNFHEVDHDLQKNRHLQMSFTYDIIYVSLRRTINDRILEII